MLERRSGGEIRNIPAEHANDYATWRLALNRHDPQAERLIMDEMNRFIDSWRQEHGGEPQDAFSSSWVPGHDWTATHGGAFQSIYDSLYAMYGDPNATLAPDDSYMLDRIVFVRSGWFFGLLLMDAFIHRRNDTWVCWRDPHKKHIDLDPLGMFYRPKEAQRYEAA